MLFNTEEKNMLTGAVATSALETVFEGYFGYRLSGGVNVATTPTDPAYWLYANYVPYFPNVSQLLSLVAFPTVLYYFGKRKHSGKLKSMATGGIIFGLAEIVGMTALKFSAAAAGQTYRVAGVR